MSVGPLFSTWEALSDSLPHPFLLTYQQLEALHMLRNLIIHLHEQFTIRILFHTVQLLKGFDCIYYHFNVERVNIIISPNFFKCSPVMQSPSYLPLPIRPMVPAPYFSKALILYFTSGQTTATIAK
jgi:hypothetical protein